MRKLHFFLVFGLGLLLAACAEQKGTVISGELAGAEGLEIYLDRLQVNGPNELLTKTPVESDGSFEIVREAGLDPGIYQLRIGAQRAAIALGEGDKRVEIEGELTNLTTYDFTVEGSETAEQLRTLMYDMNREQKQLDFIQNLAADEAVDPNIAAFITFNALSNAGEIGLPIHKVAAERLPEGNKSKATYQQYIQGLETQIMAMRSQERIQVGQPAPNITATSPDGKEYSLADLKGQVVLLDFWASWCGPCRRENPNVVKVYDKYKDDGFTIFSVSLDGMDPRRTQGLSEADLARGNEAQKKRWVQAIEADNLKWDYHVSELRKWDSAAAREYGVRGIPKTFLIDRDGKIAAVGLRGARSIEQALQPVL